MRERCERTSYTPQLTTAPNLACPQLWRSWSDFLYHDNTWNCKNMRDIQLLLSVNLQYNMLGHLDDGTNELSTKRLMFQVLFFSWFLAKVFTRILSIYFLILFYKITKIKSFECPKLMVGFIYTFWSSLSSTSSILE